jgi:NADH:ubiquinone oxidoreductase subunit 6 (subunit J)
MLAKTSFQLGVFKTLEAILAHNYPWVVKFLVIVLIINFVVAIKIGSLPEQGVLLTC